MPRPPFEILEHTADAGIVAHGDDLRQLFQNAAAGMFSLMVDAEDIREVQERRIDLEARDLEGLMVHWLTELLYHLDAEELVFSRFQVDEADETRLRARAYGERVDRERHHLHFGVKAVTRHMLEVGKEDGGYRAQVLFDI